MFYLFFFFNRNFIEFLLYVWYCVWNIKMNKIVFVFSKFLGQLGGGGGMMVRQFVIYYFYIYGVLCDSWLVLEILNQLIKGVFSDRRIVIVWWYFCLDGGGGGKEVCRQYRILLEKLIEKGIQIEGGVQRDGILLDGLVGS